MQCVLHALNIALKMINQKYIETEQTLFVLVLSLSVNTAIEQITSCIIMSVTAFNLFHTDGILRWV